MSDPAYWSSVFEEIENNLIAALERQLAEKFDLKTKVLLEQPTGHPGGLPTGPSVEACSKTDC
jgi:hypothetical protein